MSPWKENLRGKMIPGWEILQRTLVLTATKYLLHAMCFIDVIINL